MSSSTYTTLLLALGAAGAFAGMPAPAAGQTRTTHVHASTHGGSRLRSYMVDGQHSVEISLDGQVGFTPDYRDVARVSPGGMLVLEERDGGRARRLVYSAGPNGAVESAYYVNGQPQPLDDAGRAWAGDLVYQMTLDQAIDAEARTATLYREGGADAVLRTIADVRSDGGASRWYAALLAQPRLTPAEAARTFERLGRQIGSDGDKSEVLAAALEHVPLADPGVARAFFGAVRTVGSDGDASRVLLAVLARDSLADAQAALLLETAKKIGSDGDKSEVLIHAVRRGVLAGEAGRRAFFDAVETIGSDGDRSAVLRTVLQHHGDRADVVGAAVRAAHDIGSDGDKAGVLLAVPAARLQDTAVRQAYAATLASIGSDGDREAAARHGGMRER